ncbi:MAG: UTP--glucose-1-phosphate uridylyltransferase [Isosphaeraceae bacterium]|nr:UTP--glucose-1-phosphate uridylyltransferase [Isosphaeraceae bacterium]
MALNSRLGAALIETITSHEASLRDRSVLELIADASAVELLQARDELEIFRHASTNLYERVRALLFLQTIARARLQESPEIRSTGWIPFRGFTDLMARRFEQAITEFRAGEAADGPNGAIEGALAQAYESLAYQTLADQVRRSVRGSTGTRWMFRVGQADQHPLRIDPRLLEREGVDGRFPILTERTPVRLDLSHSAWSDIFFLGMDYPEGARVLNISVDLGVHGRDAEPSPPIETFARVITEPILRLTSIDLSACKDIDSLEELFNFGNDYLGLVKAGVIASGLIPPSFEGTGTPLAEILGQVIRPGWGLEVVSKVNDIPKGSRLAVSTNLLASLISLLMRATGQARNLTGRLDATAAPVVVARAILGEWLGGSGGGWQDSGGVFPGVKVIRGVPARETDPEWGVSRGRLLPAHELIDDPSEAPRFHQELARSLVLVHGGMAQNVGPILNMVTEKYLTRGAREWKQRGEALAIFDRIVDAVRRADIRELGALTTANWEGPLKGIIPWVSNHFTESIIARAKERLGGDFWGFLMLGGMSGGGMGFFVAPHRRDAFRDELGQIMREVKSKLDDALPFAMEPVVYDFRINPEGTFAELQRGSSAMMPARYYTLQVPRMIALGNDQVDLGRKADLDHFASACGDERELIRVFRTTINNLFPVATSSSEAGRAQWDEEAKRIKERNGFDSVQHESLREDLIRGRIGLARNRLPVDTEIRDVDDRDLIDASGSASTAERSAGRAAIEEGRTAVVSLAAGVGSRWTTGAGVVKALNPFVFLEGRHRSFLELHLAKTALAMERYGCEIPHVITTSFLTHDAVGRRLARSANHGHPGPVLLSRGQSIAQRLIPHSRDLAFLWEEGSHETLDENKQKVREASRRAIIAWAKSRGEGSDYVDNVPIQRFNPPGHFYEVPNLLRNGVLAELLERFPKLEWLLVHNIDTLGAGIDPDILGRVIAADAALAFEVIPRRIDDRGGGLARVNGRLRLLEGLAQPREDVEFRLRYYNTLTTWVKIDRLLDAFGLSRSDLGSTEVVAAAIRRVAARIPTYVTIKDVKRRWGHAQEDVFPVAQFEKLWGDMTSLPDLPCAYLGVSRMRGRQLKDPAQLDGWVQDGSCEYVRSLCRFTH